MDKDFSQLVITYQLVGDDFYKRMITNVNYNKRSMRSMYRYIDSTAQIYIKELKKVCLKIQI
ncbi:hypothetical protein, partial [Tenacibaculum maritimum]|uniref:hypothetical protein n=1 Tax=Tenacibaculum maritimum TaxID=107401 RepID=UPI00387770A9